MADSSKDGPRAPRSNRARIGGAVAAALACGLGVYLLLEAVRPSAGLITVSFLLMLPAAISAFVAYMADPAGERRLAVYLMVPVWILLGVIVVSAFLLREGVVCILILSPLWLISGLAGSVLTYVIRGRLKRGRAYASVLIALPLLALQLEPMLPPPPATDAVVSRSILIDAAPRQIWPLLRGIPDVRPGEGRWNLSQDLIGVPRPLGAQLIGEGLGARRLANWGSHVRFGEEIVEWSPERRIGWRFDFRDSRGWEFTDRHLRPDSPYFRVTSGGYSLTPAAEGRTRLTLETRYWMKTPVNAYSALWGELFLGDLENNLLALVKQRAERPAA